MITHYALPTDDLAGDGAWVVSDEDAEYPADNIAAPTATGHLNLPSRPSKLSTTSGYWEGTFTSPITVRAVALIYHNLDAGLDVTIEAGAFSQAITIPAHWEDGWTPSPWVEFDAPITDDVWRLSINAANSLPCQVGRLVLIGTLRSMETDVRWGEVEEEEHGDIMQPTELQVETFYALGGKRRRFNGELGYQDTEAAELITLRRSAHGRIRPWLLIPDATVNDAWLVRFEDPAWARTRVGPNFNTFPFQVRELSRGLPWP